MVWAIQYEERPCAECGKIWSPQNMHAKYCSVKCRVKYNKRKQRARASGLEPPVAKPQPKPQIQDLGEDQEAPPSLLLTQVITDLTEAGVMDTIPARAAAALAHRIESPMESGSAAASMTKELSRLIEEAKSLAPKKQDNIDHLGDSVGSKLRLVQ